MTLHIFKKNRTSGGFSLIELIVVVAIFAVISTAAVALFISVVKGNSKTNSLASIKQTGNYALDIMTYMVRNATQIVSCTSGTNGTLRLLNRDGGLTDFMVSGAGGYIASVSASASVPQTLHLSPDSVRVNPVDPGLTLSPMFSCTPAVNPTTVTIRFVIRSGDPAVNTAQDIATQTFGTTVGLRRY